MTPPKSRRFYDALREQVRSAYGSQREAAHPAPAGGDAPTSARSEWTSESRSVNHCEEQCVGQSQDQSEHQCVDQCRDHNEEQCVDQCRDQSATQLYSLGDDKAALCLSLGENPKRLLAIMIAIEKRWICLNRIPLHAQNGAIMTYPSKRTALKRLTNLGFVLSRKKKDFGTNKGLTYTLDEALCETFQALFPDVVEHARTLLREEHSEGQSEDQCEDQSQGQSESRSECFPYTSSSIKILTTMSLGDIRTLYEKHPEYAFWRERNVEARQIAHWMEEFGIDALLMDNYLRWCAYDLGVGGRTDRNGAPIDNAQNWFYGLLKRTGAYPRPSGYKSCEELRTEQLEAARAEREALARRNETLLEQNALAELQKKFSAIMAEGEMNTMYRELREQLPSFAREQEAGHGKIFEIGMWNTFKQLAGLASVTDRPAQE